MDWKASNASQKSGKRTRLTAIRETMGLVAANKITKQWDKHPRRERMIIIGWASFKYAGNTIDLHTIF